MSKTTPGKLVEALRKDFGETSAMLLAEGSLSKITNVVPTGLTVLDKHVLGVGGLPYGRLIEMFGDNGVGKTSILCCMMAGVQRDDGIAVLIDTENKFDPEWAKLHGVKVDDVVLLQPTTLEQVVAQMDAILGKGGDQPLLIALDSVAATPTEKEMENGAGGDVTVAEAARVWSRSLRVLSSKLAKRQAVLVLINQIRLKIGVLYGNPETTPGGLGIRFYATIRLSVSHGKSVKDGNEAVGKYMTVTALKNQVCPPFRKARLRLNFTTGFDDDWSILDHAKEQKLVPDTCRSVKDARKALGWEEV
jgi:recombination protein RecA